MRRLTHYGIDLVLISIILAGIHRNTGLQFDISNFNSIDIRRWFGNYLSFGELCYDKLVSILKFSGYFKQKNLILDNLRTTSNKILKDQTGRDIDDYLHK
ncbi:uncharacterized protein KGF55_003035 [Candida pseudojiufengensis]|uniref:uncharacterized protein n=1 Tax=Candida pseudojiufengensis TaxID=497109 RepID=UPI0022243CE3|nr:uncharacterized protein KGF55_003035 [Candida pseudojiufengensis]KAI5963243.1 hypothetical protein KGF55_003035 [Candida pseudojiufengensis]